MTDDHWIRDYHGYPFYVLETDRLGPVLELAEDLVKEKRFLTEPAINDGKPFVFVRSLIEKNTGRAFFWDGYDISHEWVSEHIPTGIFLPTGFPYFLYNLNEDFIAAVTEWLVKARKFKGAL